MGPYDYEKTPPSRNTILCRHTKFLEDGNMGHIRGNGRPRVSDQNVDDVFYYL